MDHGMGNQIYNNKIDKNLERFYQGTAIYMRIFNGHVTRKLNLKLLIVEGNLDEFHE